MELLDHSKLSKKVFPEKKKIIIIVNIIVKPLDPWFYSKSKMNILEFLLSNTLILL